MLSAGNWGVQVTSLLVPSTVIQKGINIIRVIIKGGGVAWWLGHWTCNVEVPGSSPPLCH